MKKFLEVAVFECFSNGQCDINDLILLKGAAAL